MNDLEKELRLKISKEIEIDLKYAMENCACLGRDAYGKYIDKMVSMVLSKIKNKVK
mgnify:CR=1 FL=1|tara:strand:- start:845 stop:1012 length:168 start_codon:yes stop_codon:yes gene_type:complete